MSYVFYNPNPDGKATGDCVVRAIARLMGKDWDEAYFGIVIQGAISHDMPSSNAVWGEYLHNNGYRRYVLPDICPQCYTVKEFCRDNPQGSFLLATGSHVVTVIDGDYYDAWDSGNEVPIYYWRKETVKDGVS